MPIPIGTFISNNVYEGRLQSQHSLSSWKTCRFVDIPNSKEAKRGNSWVVSQQLCYLYTVSQYYEERAGSEDSDRHCSYSPQKGVQLSDRHALRPAAIVVGEWAQK
jgi:hypothetical protein